jgi:hypothetical protein
MTIHHSLPNNLKVINVRSRRASEKLKVGISPSHRHPLPMIAVLDRQAFLP